jgi:hypothetical protein
VVIAVRINASTAPGNMVRKKIAILRRKVVDNH